MGTKLTKFGLMAIPFHRFARDVRRLVPGAEHAELVAAWGRNYRSYHKQVLWTARRLRRRKLNRGGAEIAERTA